MAQSLRVRVQRSTPYKLPLIDGEALELPVILGIEIFVALEESRLEFPMVQAARSIRLDRSHRIECAGSGIANATFLCAKDFRIERLLGQSNCFSFAFAMLLCLVAFFGSIAIAHSLSPDGVALLEFKKNLKDPRQVLGGWKSDHSTPCRWNGVQCNAETGRVEILNLPRQHLAGIISPHIGELTSLRRLGLHSNDFYGTIPSTIGNLTELRAIYLRNNALSGAIPAEIGMLENLKVLDVSGNSLRGQIPASVGNLRSLVFLNVSENALTGTIPSTMPKFTSESFVGNLGLCGHEVNKRCNVSSPGMKSSKLTKSLMISALGTVTACLCLALVCFWGFVLYSKCTSKPCVAEGVLRQDADSKLVLFHGDTIPSREVAKKIEQLSFKDVIGAGGLGTVYRIVLVDEEQRCKTFAVKKVLKRSSAPGCERLLERKLEILASLKHRNVVGLRGFCNGSSSRFLIYDYVSFGSLEQLLHDRKSKSLLDWDARLSIALGIAKGLGYLHHDCVPRIIHRNVKSSNILLDGHLEPRLTDVGLTKLFEDRDSHGTTIVAGTFGYMAPEYLQSGRATEKSDVYSFGVVLIELLSGRKPDNTLFLSKGVNIVGWVRSMIQANRSLEIFDPQCNGCDLGSMESMLRIAALCIRAKPEERPSMSSVVKLLEDAIIRSPSPSDDPYDTFSESTTS